MANSLRIDLTGLVVIFKQEYMTVPHLEHPFRVGGGFGASPHTAGRALFGEFLSDGEQARMEGYMVERIATDDEIDSALAKRLAAENTEKAKTSKDHRLWVNEQRTVLFRFWEDGPAEIAMRASEDDIWGAPIADEGGGNMITMLVDAPTMPPTLLPLEKPAPRKRRWWHRKPNDAEVLRHAIEVIDKRGWIKGSWVNYDGRVCILGAIGVSAMELGRKSYWPDASDLLQADSLSRRIVGSDATYLWHWNDAFSRTVGDVKRRLEVMARNADANGGKYPAGKGLKA